MCPKRKRVNASEIQLMLLASMKNLEKHIAGGINIFFKRIKTRGNLTVSWKGQEIFFVLWPDLPGVSFLHLKLFLQLSLLQRTQGKLKTHRSVSLWKRAIEAALDWSNFCKETTKFTFRSAHYLLRWTQQFQKNSNVKKAMLKSILILNTLGGFKRLQINPYQADSEHL